MNMSSFFLQQKKYFWVGKIGVLLLVTLVWGCNTSTQLQWHNEKDLRWAEVSMGYFDHTGFKSLSSAKTGIRFNNTITPKEIAQNREYLNGSGVAAGDVNGDGRIDLYFCSLNGPNKLYKNLGRMKFKDITQKAGVGHADYRSTGAVFADVDGDGDLDLLVTSLGQGNKLYLNDGNGHFNIDKHSGLQGKKGSMTMALADVDGDGDLDLYISNYKKKTVKDIYPSDQLKRKNILKTEHTPQGNEYHLIPPFDQDYNLFLTQDGKLAGFAETGETDQFYLNQGNGSFREVTDTKHTFLDSNGKPFGLQAEWGLDARFHDLNNDGLPDLYVANDFFTPDRIWINQGDGTFKEVKWSAIRNSSFSSMAVTIGDINDDGLSDLFVTEMLSPHHKRRLTQLGSFDLLPHLMKPLKSRPQYNRNTLYLQRKDHTYADISYLSNSEATGWSWATRFLDVNLDGYRDLVVNTGYYKDILNIDTQRQMIRKGLDLDDNYGKFIRKAPPLDLPNKILMNNGDLTFTDKSSDWGFNNADISQGMATADLDNDGDLDLISNRLNETSVVYENESTAPRIAVRLKGPAPNTRGIGATIKLLGGTHPQSREISAGGDYLSGSEPMAMFAADKPDTTYEIRVDWADGYQSKVNNVRPNRIYEITEPEHQAGSRNKEHTDTAAQPANSLFRDVSSRIDYHHHEDNFLDFNLQPLLPIKLSRLGPGIAWFDLNNDGHDDFFEATGKGGRMGAFENLGNGTFRPLKGFPFDNIAAGDQTAIVGWNTSNGTNLLVGNANYEQGKLHAPSVLRYRFSDGHLAETDSLPGNLPTTGPLAAADYDGDGDIDLFVGGRFMPAHYPANATSMFFRNANGKLLPDRTNFWSARDIGLITGAVFTDYDNDGDQDLLLSRAWDSLILLQNENGQYRNGTSDAGLSKLKGWWNGIATGDFNNDGYPDIVATNWGINSPFQLKNDKPIRLYYGNFNGKGGLGMIEATANKNGDYVPVRRLSNYNTIPAIASRIKTNKKFANATLKSIFRDMLAHVPYKEINTLKTTVFLNDRKGGFVPHPLPMVAQFSASFDATVADFNNDGNEDLFLGQNFFDLPDQFPRQDAGRGLLLMGNGKGDFNPVSGSKSGIKIYGEQKGAAVSDFNEDGRPDLAVSQNGEATKIYLNQAKKAGLRIKLTGPKQNKTAIGASIRLVYSDGSKGPLREIQAGSGYWSQNSSLKVMGTAGKVKAIEVTWPDGTRQTIPAKPNQMDYTISFSKD